MSSFLLFIVSSGVECGPCMYHPKYGKTYIERKLMVQKCIDTYTSQLLIFIIMTIQILKFARLTCKNNGSNSCKRRAGCVVDKHFQCIMENDDYKGTKCDQKQTAVGEKQSHEGVIIKGFPPLTSGCGGRLQRRI